MAAAVLAGGIACQANAAPLTSHPRLWITAADLPRLQSWAVASNPLWTNGVQAAALTAAAYADQHWNYTTGVPDAGWRDTGSTNWEADDTEAYAEMFAFMSLVDPVAANRPAWSQRAHALLMWEMNQAVQAPLAGAPFRDPAMITYNRANYWGEAWGLTIDWIYPSFSAADKATIRKVILQWGGQLMNANTTAFEHPQPVGLLNNKRMLGSAGSQKPAQREAAQLQLRWTGNNYYIGHMRNLALLSAAFDDADDFPVKKGLDGSVAGLRTDVLGAWLYQAYAMFEDPAVSGPVLGISTANNRSLGLAYGGLPLEGPLYGESIGYLDQTLLALSTAGLADPAIAGPQAGLVHSTFWDRTVDGFLHSISPLPQTLADATYLGPVYRMAGYGDELEDYVTYDRIDTFGPLAITDRLGNPQRYAKEQWIVRNALQGGAAGLNGRAANVWGNSNASYSILYFLALDPSVTPPADPRPGLTPFFTAPAMGRVLAHSNWSDSASWFTFRCGAETINHVGGDCGQFEFYRNGQWLTKEWSGYADDGLAYLPEYHNMVAVQNNTPADLNSLYAQVVAYGGQWNNGGNAGDPGVRISAQDGFAYARANATNLYNHPDFYSPQDATTKVQSVVRDVVWLNPDYVIVHDSTQTAVAGLARTSSLVLPAIPSINGTTAVMTSNGQQLTVQALLPAHALLSAQQRWTTTPSTEFDRVSDEEVSVDRLVITSKTFPAKQSFLAVLQGQDAGGVADPAGLVVSSAGSGYEGAVVDQTAVLFASSSAVFKGTSYSVPATTTRQIITGLVPGAGYTVTTSTAGAAIEVTITPGGPTLADGGGILSVGFAASVDAPQTYSSAPRPLLGGAPWSGGF
jgi:hypothetical protein